MPKTEKGMRYGGRQKGSLNKKTLKALSREKIAEQAASEVDKAHRGNVKLGKDILEDYVLAFATVAAWYQNKLARTLASGQPPSKEDLEGFEKWGALTAQHAKGLAEFQSPKFKAIAIASPPPSTPKINPNNVHEIGDQHAAARIYQQMIQKTA